VFEGKFALLPAGDVQRMPGAFLLQNTQIKNAFRTNWFPTDPTTWSSQLPPDPPFAKAP